MNIIARSALFAILSPWLVFASCKQSGDFAGGSGGGVNKPRPQTIKPQPTAPETSIQCTETKLVGIKSLSSFIYQGGSSKSFDVELTFLPCPLQTLDLELPIKFDLDAYIQFANQSDKSISYELLVDNSRQSAGKLRQSIGSDLFGKDCPKCFYFLSDFPLKADPKLSKAVIRLDLTTFSVRGPTSSQNPATQNFTVPLNVRVGEAAPVTGQLTFTPMGL